MKLSTSYRILLGYGAAIGLAGMTGYGADDAQAAARKAKKMEAVEKYTVEVISSKDNTPQKAIFYNPENPENKPLPLLVALHTWSFGYQQGVDYVGQARKRGWVMIAPDFRGPNRRPEACASALAVQDVLDAVEYAKQKAHVDESRIYVVGASGGGHMSLVMAARAPQVWAAVSAWVPISDLAAWHAQNLPKGGNYSKMLEKVCGGAPGPETSKEYAERSSVPFLAAAAGLPLDINAGIHDGHTGSVPISHSLRAFNVVAEANGQKEKQLTDEEIEFMTAKEAVPENLAAEHENDPERSKAILFRRVAGTVRVTIFEGGHDAEVEAALNWLSRQQKGCPANMSVSASGSAKQQAGTQEVAH